MTVRVAVDAMGGDHAPRAIVRGAVQAAVDDPELEIVLVGDASRVRQELASTSCQDCDGRVHVVPASEVVGMSESPIEAVRAKKDSSIVRAASLAASGEVDALLSAGNTGATAVISKLTMKALVCVSRPGIAVTIPSFHGPFVLCDVGANLAARPQHLYEYAVMAGVYAELVIGIKQPRVALLSIGEESGKGPGLIRHTHALLDEDDSINFVGNVEGRELFEDRCDVAICEGFVGNVILKLVEGLAEGLFRTMAREFEDEEPSLQERFGQSLERVRTRHDYSRFGGAPLLGLDGVCIVCHGRSGERAIRNAVRVAKRFVVDGLNDAIVARLA